MKLRYLLSLSVVFILLFLIYYYNITPHNLRIIYDVYTGAVL